MPTRRLRDTAGERIGPPEERHLHVGEPRRPRPPAPREDEVEVELEGEEEAELEPAIGAPASFAGLSELSYLTAELEAIDAAAARVRERWKAAIREAAGEHTQVQVAEAAGITRQRVSKLLEGGREA